MKYRLYGFDACPYCSAAIDLLLFEDAELEIVKIEDPNARKAFMDERGFVAPNRTFPRVYRVVDNQERLIGGFTDLEGFLGKKLAA